MKPYYTEIDRIIIIFFLLGKAQLLHIAVQGDCEVKLHWWIEEKNTRKRNKSGVEGGWRDILCSSGTCF